ncbi:MAG: PEP-CTERM sorting domain-containing protein [Burkholderiales bacterium]
MLSLLKSLAAALAAGTLIASTPAAAVSFVGHAFEAPAAGNSVTSYGSGATQSFDVNFGAMTRVTLAFITFRDEVAPTMSFNALVGNFTGLNLNGLLVRLTGGAVFEAPYGTVTGNFGVAAPPVVSPTLVSTGMLVPEPLQLSFGNPLGAMGQSDWVINFSGVDAGSTFGVSVTAVPEPGAYMMLLAGLALMGAVARSRGRGRNQDLPF